MSKYLAIIVVALFAFATLFPHMMSKQQVETVATKLESTRIEEIPSFIVQKFNSWKSAHNKIYESIEVELYRMAIYYSNFITIQMTNAAQSDYELGENQFMDLA